jgi:hypothetical protein
MTSTTPLLLILATLAQNPATPAARTEYYLSESRVLAPDGKPLGALAGLIRREYRPDAGTIVEQSIALDPAPDALPTVVTLEWTVDADGEMAILKERTGKISGRAKLVGKPWAWTEWSWTGTMKDVPGTFRTACKLTPRGASTRTERIDAAGKRLEVFDQVDTRISKESYDVLRSKFLPQ